MKKVLVIHYSQTGQLSEIVKNFCKPLEGLVDLEFQEVKPTQPFPFPWTNASFFDLMPECVTEQPISIEKLELNHSKYDLIILGYSPWFLSPSLPTTSLFFDENFKSVLNRTKVITLIGSRNMWINSNEKIRKKIKENGGIHIGNVALSDKNNNQISAFTIIHWLFKGKKTKKWGVFPKPGISDKEIKEVEEEGTVLRQLIEFDNLDNFQSDMLALNKMKIPTDIWFIESKAKKIFRIWADLILKKGTTKKKRKVWVKVYQYYLVFALFIVAPILFVIFNIFVRPFVFRKIREDKQRILNLS